MPPEKLARDERAFFIFEHRGLKYCFYVQCFVLVYLPHQHHEGGRRHGPFDFCSRLTLVLEKSDHAYPNRDEQ